MTKDLTSAHSDYRGVYRVFIWSGAGYILDEFVVNAQNEEHALEIVTQYIVMAGYRNLYVTERELEDMFPEIDDLWESPEVNESYVYVDATMEGAPYPVWVNNFGELRIEKVN